MSRYEENHLSFSTSADDQAFKLDYDSQGYKVYTSNEIISGRKCFEFKWENGTGGLVAGFQSERTNLWIFMPGTSFQMIWEKDGNRLIEEYVNISTALNTKYMACINTYDNIFFLQINRLSKYFVYTPAIGEKFKVVTRCGQALKTAYGRLYFGNTGFENSLPPRYTPVIDRSIDIGNTCRLFMPFHITPLHIYVFISV